MPFLAIALLGIIVLLLAARWLKNPEVKETILPPDEDQRPKMNVTLVFLGLLLLSLIIQLAVTLFETVFSVYAKDVLTFDTSQIGLGFMLCGLIMAALQPLFASLGEKTISIKKQLLIGFTITAISMSLFPLWTSSTYVYMMIIIFATGGAMITPNLITMISFIDENRRGVNLSTQTSVNSAGQVLGPLAGMWLYNFDDFWPFLIIAIILLLVTVSTIPRLKFNT